MHYHVLGKTIRSERAAKSWRQPSAHVLAWIAALPRSFVALDYGCGKLRYTIPLASRVKSVQAVDSALQLKRLQCVGGYQTTVSAYVAKHLPNARALDVDSEAWRRRRYDAVLCTNVLSAIPTAGARMRVLNSIGDVLKPRGRVLLSTQYRNEYFRRYRDVEGAERCLDGWLVPCPAEPNAATFYGLIDRYALTALADSAGLGVIQSYHRGESAYVVAESI